jgi:hypothetical protein
VNSVLLELIDCKWTELEGR